jgi:hypothetical protein
MNKFFKLEGWEMDKRMNNQVNEDHVEQENRNITESFLGLPLRSLINSPIDSAIEEEMAKIKRTKKRTRQDQT